jgi:hypothetical protein
MHSAGGTGADQQQVPLEGVVLCLLSVNFALQLFIMLSMSHSGVFPWIEMPRVRRVAQIKNFMHVLNMNIRVPLNLSSLRFEKSHFGLHIHPEKTKALASLAYAQQQPSRPHFSCCAL